MENTKSHNRVQYQYWASLARLREPGPSAMTGPVARANAARFTRNRRRPTAPPPRKEPRRSEPHRKDAHGQEPPRNEPRHSLARRAQRLTLEYYEARGFCQVAHRQHRRVGEIDLIVFDGHTLAFVEVKAHHVPTTMGARYDWECLGWPSTTQYKHLRKAIYTWLTEQGSRRPYAREMRMDVMKVIFDERDELVRMHQIPAAWEGAW